MIRTSGQHPESGEEGARRRNGHFNRVRRADCPRSRPAAGATSMPGCGESARRFAGGLSIGTTSFIPHLWRRFETPARTHQTEDIRAGPGTCPHICLVYRLSLAPGLPVGASKRERSGDQGSPGDRRRGERIARQHLATTSGVETDSGLAPWAPNITGVATGERISTCSDHRGPERAQHREENCRCHVMPDVPRALRARGGVSGSFGHERRA